MLRDEINQVKAIAREIANGELDQALNSLRNEIAEAKAIAREIASTVAREIAEKAMAEALEKNIEQPQAPAVPVAGPSRKSASKGL